MATAPGALIRSVPQRAIPAPTADGGGGGDLAVRLFSYGEIATQPLVRKSHNLADEGSYYIANNLQTAIVPTYGTSFAATSPFITIYNSNASARIYLDYISLVNLVALVCTTTIGYTAFGALVDNINRFTSGGTSLGAGSNVNMAAANNSGAIINCGAITATAASANVRSLVGIRNVRPGLSTTVGSVIGDTHTITCGGVEGNAAGQVSVTASISNLIPVGFPPVVIPPGSTFLFYIWYPVLSAPSAATYAPEIGFWVR